MHLLTSHVATTLDPVDDCTAVHAGRLGRCSWCASCARSLARTHGTAQRAADQIGCGVESLHTWVKQADVELAKSDAIDAEAIAVAILRYPDLSVAALDGPAVR